MGLRAEPAAISKYLTISLIYIYSYRLYPRKHPVLRARILQMRMEGRED